MVNQAYLCSSCHSQRQMKAPVGHNTTPFKVKPQLDKMNAKFWCGYTDNLLMSSSDKDVVANSNSHTVLPTAWWTTAGSTAEGYRHVTSGVLANNVEWDGCPTFSFLLVQLFNLMKKNSKSSQQKGLFSIALNVWVSKRSQRCATKTFLRNTKIFSRCNGVL